MGITTPSLSSSVTQIGTYTITVPGKYLISLYGEAGHWNNDTGYSQTAVDAAGGILKVAKVFNSATVIKIKGIKGSTGSYVDNWSNSSVLWGGAGIAMYENDVVKMVAGGGAGYVDGGGGYVGGQTYWPTNTGWWNVCSGACLPASGIVSGKSTTYCASTSCSDGAYGGRWWSWNQSANSNLYGYGGRGYCDSDYCNSENYYEIIPGGNGDYTPRGGSSTVDVYSNKNHGNWGTTTLTGGAGYASITYCGPSADSTCPQ